MQIIGQMVNIQIPFHPIVSHYIRIAAVAQLNLEIMQHSCLFGEEELAVYSKIRFFFFLPILLFGALGVLGVLLQLHAKAKSAANPVRLRVDG